MKGVAVLLLLFAPIAAFADSLMPDAHYANVQLSDPAKEVLAKDLMLSVRCIVCQGQSVADSDADMAGDMRALIRKRIERGESPENIRSWLIERYGNYISYEPPISGIGAPLWIAPLLFLAFGIWIARGRFRRR
jgi:cytochrome c-type biogenesis protein CcmH